MTNQKIRTIKAKFASKCPQCWQKLAAGQEVAVTHDGVWRCPRCTQMFAEIGPFDKQESIEQRNARVNPIVASYDMAWSFRLEGKAEHVAQRDAQEVK